VALAAIYTIMVFTEEDEFLTRVLQQENEVWCKEIYWGMVFPHRVWCQLSLNKLFEDLVQSAKNPDLVKTSASARRISNKQGGVIKNVQHSAPFSRATSPSLIVCLYLAYSKIY